MADEIVVPANLKQRFSEFQSIAEITGRLRQNIDKINEANKDAAGQDDATANAYHKQVDRPTRDVSQLVGDIERLFGLTSQRGQAAADSLDDSDSDAADAATAWVPVDEKTHE